MATIIVKQLGDLKVGMRYTEVGGEEHILTDVEAEEGHVVAVNLASGKSRKVPTSLRVSQQNGKWLAWVPTTERVVEAATLLAPEERAAVLKALKEVK